ncbi:hypothetical protein GALL_311460 [mine drainage metagenome]|uniref:Uncharacterized protein n=1 Tax=mine drainage metagenome TaxID=410659 RepID=A0A1J5R4R7_9ZZZZ
MFVSRAAVIAVVLLLPGLARAGEVTIAGTPVYVTREDCQALLTYQPSDDVTYHPGQDVHGNYVAPADLGGDAGVQLPERIEFPLMINPMNYTGVNKGTATTQPPYANTAVPVAQVTVDLKTGRTFLNGHPLDGEQDAMVRQACRGGGHR